MAAEGAMEDMCFFLVQVSVVGPTAAEIDTKGKRDEPSNVFIPLYGIHSPLSRTANVPSTFIYYITLLYFTLSLCMISFSQVHISSSFPTFRIQITVDFLEKKVSVFTKMLKRYYHLMCYICKRLFGHGFHFFFFLWGPFTWMVPPTLTGDCSIQITDYIHLFLLWFYNHAFRLLIISIRLPKKKKKKKKDYQHTYYIARFKRLMVQMLSHVPTCRKGGFRSVGFATRIELL